MDPRTQQVPLSVIEECLGGNDMHPDQLQYVKDFRNLDTKTTLKSARKLEKKFYIDICRAGNSIAAVAAKASKLPKLVVKTTSDWPETGSNDMKIDVAIYPTCPEAKDAYTVEGRGPYAASCAWQWMISGMEVKRSGEPSGFWFPSGNVDEYEGPAPLLVEGDDKQTAARAQFFKYATEIMLRQHRSHLFAFYICGPWVRAFRFDRSGCIVSEPFHVVRSRRVLPNLLYRLFCASPAQQGFDDTIKRPTPKELQDLVAFNPNDPLLKHYKDWMLNERHLYPVYKVECPVVSLTDEARKTTRKPKQLSLLIGKPVACHYSLTGRCTRGYVAFDLSGSRLVFFKDQWRSVSRRRTELETYRLLHEKGVRFIATPIGGGDVEPHRTIAHRYMKLLPERVHTRLVTKEVGRILEDYANVAELLQAITYALVAHRQAWEKAGVLHRDVSIGNIMIDSANDKGFLNDWDLARYADDLDQPASEPGGISGTWPYKSALSLRYSLKPPEVADDMESFIYVVYYMAVRFHRNRYSPARDLRGLSPDQQKSIISTECLSLAGMVHVFFYEEHTCSNGISTGGTMKLISAKGGSLPIALTPNADPPCTHLATFIQEAWALLQEHYRTIDFDALSQYDPQAEEHGTPRSNDEARNVGTPHVTMEVAEAEGEEENEDGPTVFDDAASAFSDIEPGAVPHATRARTTVEGPGPLSTHKPLLALLRSMLQDPKVYREMKAEVKYADQFRGLRSVTVTVTKNPSGSPRKLANIKPAAAAEGYEDSARTLPGGMSGIYLELSMDGSEDAPRVLIRVPPSDEPPRLGAPLRYSSRIAERTRIEEAPSAGGRARGDAQGRGQGQGAEMGKGKRKRSEKQPVQTAKVRTARKQLTELQVRRSSRLAQRCR